MANKKISELTTATGATTSWYVPVCDPATGLAYKMTASAFSTLIGGGGGDVTAPTVVSAVANTATTIVVTFSESVTATIAGWSFKKNGSAWTIVNVTGSGSSWTFNMATSAVIGDTLLRTYDSGTGGTIDASSNELASFTDSSVTNSIGDTTAPTVSSATATTATNVRIIFSESVTVTTAGWSFKKNGSTWSASSVSGSGTTWDFTMGASAGPTDTLLYSYDSTTGATTDTASNELVSVTDQSIANSVEHTSNFTAANGTGITSYTPDSGSPWENSFGTWEIQSNQAVTLTLPGDNNAWMLTPVAAVDKVITVVCSGITSVYFVQIIVRATDKSNYLIVQLSSGAVNVYQGVSGSLSTLRTDSLSTDSAEHTWVVTVTGTNLALKKDGVDVFTTQAFSSSVTYAKAGVGQAGGASVAQVTFNSFTAV